MAQSANDCDDVQRTYPDAGADDIDEDDGGDD